MRSPQVRKVVRMAVWAGMAVLAACLLSVFTGGRGARIENPRPVKDARNSPGPLEFLLQALHVREYPPLRLDAGQETALAACIKISRLINRSINGVPEFDDPDVREQLLAWRQRMSQPFYAEFLLAKWYERHGDAAEARRWMQQALKDAPIVLVRRYEFADGTPLAHTNVETLGVECRMKTATSPDTYQNLEYIDLTTDEKGQVYLPCYDTRIRCVSVHWPRGYEIEVGRHGYLEIEARYSLLPAIRVWKKGSPRPATDLRPSEFYDYKDAQQVQDLTHRVGRTEFRIDRCFRLAQDGTILATDGREAISLADKDPPSSFGAPLACLDQAVVHFGTSAGSGYAILQVRLFDHRSRSLLTEYHAPAAWSYDGRDEILLKSFARPLPERVDVWFWVATFDPQDTIQKILPQVGAEAQLRACKAVLTHLHTGVRGYSTSGTAITFQPPIAGEEHGLQAAFQIARTQINPPADHVRVLAVSKDGARLMAEHVIYPSNHVVVCDFPLALSDLDHFEFFPVGRESCFFFDGVVLPGMPERELAQNWQVIIPTHGRTGSFTTAHTQPAHLKVTILPGQGSMSFHSHQVVHDVVGHAYWTYESRDRNPDTHSTIVCEMTGLSTRMLKTEIIPLDANNVPLENGQGWGRSGTVTFRSFRIPTGRIHAVRVVLSWNAE